MTATVRKIVKDRANGQCENCGRGGVLEYHHIIYKSQGGKDTVLNGIMLCADCHRGTHGVHGREGKALNIKLKIELQEKYFALGYSEDETRENMGGRLYYEE